MPGDAEGRYAALLAFAPQALRDRGFEPAPGPWKPRRWRSEVWIGKSASDGRTAVALPVANVHLQEILRHTTDLSKIVRPARNVEVRPDVVLLLVGEGEPVRVEALRAGLRPELVVVRVPGVSARAAPDAPFRHEVRIVVEYP